MSVKGISMTVSTLYNQSRLISKVGRISKNHVNTTTGYLFQDRQCVSLEEFYFPLRIIIEGNWFLLPIFLLLLSNTENFIYSCEKICCHIHALLHICLGKVGGKLFSKLVCPYLHLEIAVLLNVGHEAAFGENFEHDVGDFAGGEVGAVG